MSGSIFITLNTSDSDIARRVVNAVSGRRNECLADLTAQLQACKSRVSGDVVRVQYNSSVAAVNASGTITVTADIAADDTVVIAGVTLTCKASGTAADTFVKGASPTATATNLVAAILANATLNKIVTASNVAGVTTVTCLVPGTIGNLITLSESSNVASGITVSGANLASGAGGPSQAAVSF